MGRGRAVVLPEKLLMDGASAGGRPARRPAKIAPRAIFKNLLRTPISEKNR